MVDNVQPYGRARWTCHIERSLAAGLDVGCEFVCLVAVWFKKAKRHQGFEGLFSLSIKLVSLHKEMYYHLSAHI